MKYLYIVHKKVNRIEDMGYKTNWRCFKYKFLGLFFPMLNVFTTNYPIKISSQIQPLASGDKNG